MICQVHFQFFSRQRRTLGARGFFLAAECFGSTAKVTIGELTWPKPEAAHEKSLTKAICAINCKIQLLSWLSWSHSLRQCGCNRVLSHFSAFGDVSHALSCDHAAFVTARSNLRYHGKFVGNSKERRRMDIS